MPFFTFEGQRLAYTEFAAGRASASVASVAGRRSGAAGAAGAARGASAASAGRGGRSAGPEHALIMLHGLLLSQQMHHPLAEELAAHGNRVITLDLLGHGRSARPRDMWRYSMRTYGEQVVALMDHLKLEQAVVMGTSLGANVALEVAAEHPERLRGLVIEMPVLDNALMWSALAFTPLLVALTFGEPVMRLLSRVTSAVPRRLLPHHANVALDVVRQEPGPSGALLQGLFFGRIAPPRSERRTFDTPTLVLGHPRDPVHPFSDADMLVKELPNGRLVRAESIVELRMQPERLTEEIAAFVDETWGEHPRASPRASGERHGARNGGTPERARSGRSTAKARSPRAPKGAPAAKARNARAPGGGAAAKARGSS